MQKTEILFRNKIDNATKELMMNILQVLENFET
jgi:hypothetical protein